MLSHNLDTSLFVEHSQKIQPHSVKEAYRYLAGLAADLPDFECEPNNKGEVCELKFYRKGSKDKHPYALIVNQNSLLFYVRYPQDASFSNEMREAINSSFEVKQDENSRQELRFRIENLEHAQRIANILFAA
ncbi:MAG: hypothetical protein HND56_10415 [Pseudomonadota bacterium]|jgi:hypothetical protein|nr:hypothetical protein [Pseudomonadota bacterium]QKK06074.1 MAG: hypothetical protein HND56_10415 [Pseudomonadota bacterium]